jgi:hypothetical protein
MYHYELSGVELPPRTSGIHWREITACEAERTPREGATPTKRRFRGVRDSCPVEEVAIHLLPKRFFNFHAVEESNPMVMPSVHLYNTRSRTLTLPSGRL